MITIGDFNAKTGTGKNKYLENIRKYGKGKLNTNGSCLLENAKENDMILTNTMFHHKMCHRTTWTAPDRTTDHNQYDGNPRRNPYRNQIDHGTIIRTGITCKKIPCYMSDSACSWFIVKNVKIFHSYVKHF